MRLTGTETPEDFFQTLKQLWTDNLPLPDAPPSDEKPNTVLVLDGPSFAMFNELDTEQR